MCVFADLSLHSAWLSNLFWFCLVSWTRSQLPFKGQIWAKWATLSYRGNRLNKALCLHHWLSHTRTYDERSLGCKDTAWHPHTSCACIEQRRCTQTHADILFWFLINANLIGRLNEICFCILRHNGGRIPIRKEKHDRKILEGYACGNDPFALVRIVQNATTKKKDELPNLNRAATIHMNCFVGYFYELIICFAKNQQWRTPITTTRRPSDWYQMSCFVWLTQNLRITTSRCIMYHAIGRGKNIYFFR